MLVKWSENSEFVNFSIKHVFINGYEFGKTEMDRPQRALKKKPLFRSIYCIKMFNISSKFNGNFEV